MPCMLKFGLGLGYFIKNDTGECEEGCSGLEIGIYLLLIVVHLHGRFRERRVSVRVSLKQAIDV